jgi:hypothetical protein
MLFSNYLAQYYIHFSLKAIVDSFAFVQSPLKLSNE